MGADLVSGSTPSRRSRLEQDQPGIDACLDAIPGLQPEEKELLLFLLSQPGSSEPLAFCA